MGEWRRGRDQSRPRSCARIMCRECSGELDRPADGERRDAFTPLAAEAEMVTGPAATPVATPLAETVAIEIAHVL